jgi:hypothetical protein
MSINIESITIVLQTSKLSNHQTYTKNPKMITIKPWTWKGLHQTLF